MERGFHTSFLVAWGTAACYTKLHMQEIPIVLGFTSGELSPWLGSRFDLQAYQRGAAEITNFQIQPYGGIQLRPGTRFVNTLLSENVRLVPFYYAENDALMLEFFPGGMHVYKDGRLLTTQAGETFVLPTPWSTAGELETLHFNQVNDAVYVSCPTHPPVVLYRYTDTSWTCVQPSFHVMPRETYAQQQGLLTVEFENDGEYASLTIQAGEHRFTPAMEGNEIVLADATMPARILFANSAQKTKAVAAPDISAKNVALGAVLYQEDSASAMCYFYRCIRPYSVSSFNGSKLLRDYPHFFQPGIMRLDDSNEPYEVAGDWDLQTTGNWNAYWEVWRSYDTPDEEPDFHLWNWTCVKTFSQSNHETRQNWAISGSEDRPCRMVLVCRCCTDPDTLGAMVQFRILRATREYRFRITSVTDAQHARARVMQTYLGMPVSFSTRMWSFAAMGPRNGYPAFSAMFQGRLWLGGMPGLPTTLLASAIDDFQNFRMGSNDDDALHLNIMGSDQSRICWLCATRQLLVGTSDSEWVLVSGNGSTLTPTSVSFRRQSSVGSESIPARAVENTIMFVQRGSRRMREIAYRLEADGFSTTDISMLAEHLFAAGIKEWCVQRGANFNIWALMKDNSLAMLTINLEQQVTAWQRVALKGRRVLTLAALQSKAGKEDDVWLAVQVENTGAVVLECMSNDTPHLDCLEELVSDRDGTLKCAAHLAGHDVCVQDVTADESVMVTAEASGLQNVASVRAGRTYRAGIPLEARLRTMPMESNASFNSVRQFSRFKLRLLESDTDFEFRSTANDIWEHHLPDKPDMPFTGSLRLAQMPDAGVGQSLCIRYTGHRDFRILAITQEVDHHGK